MKLATWLLCTTWVLWSYSAIVGFPIPRSEHKTLEACKNGIDKTNEDLRKTRVDVGGLWCLPATIAPREHIDGPKR